MKLIAFKKILSDLHVLTAVECVKANKGLYGREQKVQGSLSLREVEDAIKSYPHCDGKKLIKTGCEDDRQQFKCKDCKKTFNAFTGTPLARLRMSEKHLENADCMVDGMSVRKTAEKLDVDPSTAFCLRHRFLWAQRAVQPAWLRRMKPSSWNRSKANIRTSLAKPRLVDYLKSKFPCWSPVIVRAAPFLPP